MEKTANVPDSPGKKIGKEAAVLFVITVLAGALLAFVNAVTKEPIRQRQLAAIREAYSKVLPEAVDFKELPLSTEYEENGAKTEAYRGAYVTKSVQGFDENQKPVGYVVNVVSPSGFGGDIELSVGFDSEGTVRGVEILTINETAGLGMNAADESFLNQYLKAGTNGEFRVTKNGAADEFEIDAITSATITSKAVTDGVNVASALVREGGSTE